MSQVLRRPLWLMLLAGTLVMFITFGVRGGFGQFLLPMSETLGWGREIFSLAIAIQNLLWGALQPVAGGLADRYGAGKSLLFGTLMYGLGVYLMSQAATPELFHLTAGGMIGIGLAFGSMGVVMPAIARATPPKYRTLAMGIVNMGGSAGMLVLVPVGQEFINAWGWQTALAVLSLFAIVNLLLAPVLSGKSEVPAGGQSFGQALSEARRHAGYWFLIGGFFVCGFHVTFIGVHLTPYLVDSGLDPSLGALALAVIGGANIFGSLAAGVLGDRYSKKYVLSLLYAARAALMAAFVLVPLSEVTVLVFAAIMGLLWLSTVPLTSGLVGQIFGPQYMGMLFGFVFFSHQIGAFFGVWLGGLLFDLTGSYDVVWWLGVALGLISAALHFPIDEKPIVRTAQA
ncbi:MAG: MFS transporter [Pseudomonadota bacterium]|nr:MFS transporter [Pseudomonadota bacterium]